MLNLELILDRKESRRMNVITDLFSLRYNSTDYIVSFVNAHKEGNLVKPYSPNAVSIVLARTFHKADSLSLDSNLTYKGSILDPLSLLDVDLGYSQKNLFKTKKELYKAISDLGINLDEIGFSGIPNAESVIQKLKEKEQQIPGIDRVLYV